MPLWDGAEVRALERIADALEIIALEIEFRLNRPKHARSVNLMALPTGQVNVGDTGDFTATAVDENGATVSGLAVTVASSDDTLLTVTGSSDAGVFTGTWTAVAAGSPTLTASVLNPDGSTVDTGANNPATFQIGAPVPTVATAVNLA